jgi:hypothetical protein
MNDFLEKIAPTVATALLGPLGGVAVAGLTKILGIEDGTVKDVAKAISDGRITPDQIAQIKELELKYKNDEAERGFKYADLAFKDRDSARRANVDGGVQKHMFWMSIILLVLTLGCEVWVLFNGYPDDKLPEVVVGRILGLMDAVCMMVLTYWYGTTSNSLAKTNLLAQSTPPAKVS